MLQSCYGLTYQAEFRLKLGTAHGHDTQLSQHATVEQNPTQVCCSGRPSLAHSVNSSMDPCFCPLANQARVLMSEPLLCALHPPEPCPRAPLPQLLPPSATLGHVLRHVPAWSYWWTAPTCSSISLLLWASASSAPRPRLISSRTRCRSFRIGSWSNRISFMWRLRRRIASLR